MIKIVRFQMIGVRRSWLVFVGLLWSGVIAHAANWYVATNGTGDGTSWANATNSIQDAISLATTAGDTVWVSNGLYETAGVTNWPNGGLLTNRVAITNAITVRSANGPALTIIKGAWDSATNGPTAVRCVFMTNNASLSGFTLTNGATMAGGAGNVNDCNGGGIFSLSTSAVISNCIITGNSAHTNGAGAYAGFLYNCLISGNLARNGGGTYASILYNCTVVSNTATSEGGGVYGGTAVNSIVYFNGVSNWYSTAAFTNSCTTPDPGGAGNITNNPLFLNANAGNWRLSTNSPCINTGTNQDWMIPPGSGTVDLDGLLRILQRTVDIGAYESAYLLSLRPAAFTNTVMRGSSTNFSTFLTNSASETQLYWQAVNTSVWVTLSASTGMIATNNTNQVTITNSALSLAPQTHYSRLNILPTNNLLALYYPQTGTVDMTLNVAEFGRSATTVAQTVKQSGTTNVAVNIWNIGAGELPYTITTNVSWLNVSPVSGVLTGQTAGATNGLTLVFTNTLLPVGAYYGKLTLAPTGIVGASLDINVELTVTNGPQMTVDPLILTGAVMMGQNLTNQTITVSNASTTEQIGYNAGTNQSWLAVTGQTNGVLAPQTATNLTISYQTSGLTTNSAGAPSNHNATITVTATTAGALGSPANVTVSLTVNPKSRLSLSTTLLTNTVTEGYDAADRTFDVWNGNSYYTLSYSISDNADWLMASPVSGTSIGEHDEITVEFSTAGFTAGGVSNALITVVGRAYDGTHYDSALDATQTITVALTVIPLAALAADASSTYEFSARFGHAVAPTSFQIWNAGAGGSVLQYTIATNAAWLSARPTSGTSAGEEDEITLACNSANLSPGRYEGVLTITGMDQATGQEAYSSPLNINVGLTILSNKGFDFGGDGGGASDLIVYQETNGLWSITNLFSGYATNVMFGGKEYVAVPGDYDGDMLSDLGVYRHASGYWYVRRINQQSLVVFGGSYWAGPELASLGGYVSVAGDYDGDGLTDPAMYREINGLWSGLFSSLGYVYVSGTFGGSGYAAIPADYDGDELTDPAVYDRTTGQWYVTYSGDSYRIISGIFGGSGWTAVPADYDGDTLADPTIYNETTGLWIILPSSTASTRGYVPVTAVLGGTGFTPVPADYNGDGLADICVYEEAVGNWYIVSITGTRIAWPARHGGYGFAPVKP